MTLAIKLPDVTIAESGVREPVTLRDDRLKLRVLAGRSAGAEHRLPSGRTLRIGHSFESDIVLRSRQTQGCALKLQIADDCRLQVEMMAGRARVLGRDLAVGETIGLAPYLPITMGDFSFAIGRGDESRWAEATVEANVGDDVAGLTSPVVPETHLAERIALRSQPARARFGILIERPALLAAVGAVLLVGATAAMVGSAMVQRDIGGPDALRAELAAAGFPALQIERRSSGVLGITGLVSDDAKVTVLRRWVATNAPGAQVEVETIDGMAAAANDLLAAQNVDAKARALGAAGLVIEGPFLPGDRRRELTALIRRDMPLVKQVGFRASGSPGENELAYFFNSPGYGAVSFVDGNPGYIVTEDGSRWFEGAQLPTGHRILKIGGGSLTVERHGLQDTLVM